MQTKSHLQIFTPSPTSKFHKPFTNQIPPPPQPQIFQSSQFLATSPKSLYKPHFYCYNSPKFTKRLSLESIIIELLTYHLWLCMPLFLFPLANLYALFFFPSHTKKLKILALVAPAYYLFLSASVFSGLVIWAMLGFVFNYKILAMLIIWLIVFIFEIKRHKKQKLIRVEADFSIREAFFKWAKTKYLFDFCAFGLTFILWS